MSETSQMPGSVGSPKVSVIMAVYNGEKYVHEAITSILNQSLRDLEFVIVNDCSTDGTPEILASMADKDGRIKIVNNESNLGLASSLNRAIEASSGEYLARMDDDDISLRNRLSKQVSFLDAHPDIDICGTGAIVFGFFRRRANVRESHEDICARLLFSNPMFHPSIMFRRSSFPSAEPIYEDARVRVEDLELWYRLSATHKMANINQKLVKYRTYDPKNLKKRDSVVAHGNLIRREMLEKLVGEVTEDQFYTHMKIAKCSRNCDLGFLDEVKDWLMCLYEKNRTRKEFDTQALMNVISERWWRVCKSTVECGFPAWHRYRAAPNELMHYQPKFMNLGFLLKASLRRHNGDPSIQSEDFDFIRRVPD